MAAIGDMFADIAAAVGDNDYCDIQPAAGHEAVVHNIYYEDDIEIYRYDGVNEILGESFTGKGVYSWLDFHVGNVDRIRVKNVGGEAHNIGYDGIYTKVT